MRDGLLGHSDEILLLDREIGNYLLVDNEVSYLEIRDDRRNQ